MLASWRSLTKIAGSIAGSGSVRQRSGPADPCTTLLGFYTAQIYFEEWPIYGLSPLCVLCKFLCVPSSSLIYTVSRNSGGYACCTCNFVNCSSGLCLPAWILNIDDCLASVVFLSCILLHMHAYLSACICQLSVNICLLSVVVFISVSIFSVFASTCLFPCLSALFLSAFPSLCVCLPVCLSPCLVCQSDCVSTCQKAVEPVYNAT
jgi:hypothetical protein